MSSELTAWIRSERLNYFTKQANYYDESSTNFLPKKQKLPPENLQRNTTTNTNNKRIKKRLPRQRHAMCYAISLDPILQLSYAQLNRVGWREDTLKQKEVTKTNSVSNKRIKPQLPWSNGEERIVEFYKLSNSYSSCRLAKTDKRELVRIAQDIQTANRLRRTGQPIVNSAAQNLVMQPVTNQMLCKLKPEKKPKRTLVIPNSKQNSCKPKPVNASKPEKSVKPKKRKMPKEINIIPKVKQISREFMEVKTVELNFDGLSLRGAFREDPVCKFPNIRRKSYKLNSSQPKNSKTSSFCSDTNSELKSKYQELFPSVNAAKLYKNRGKEVLLANGSHNNDFMPKDVDLLNGSKGFSSCTKGSLLIRDKVGKENVNNITRNSREEDRINYKAAKNVYTIGSDYANIKTLYDKKIDEERARISKLLLKDENSILEKNQHIKLFLGSNIDCETGHGSFSRKIRKKKSGKDYVNILRPVVISSGSGTKFEMKPMEISPSATNGSIMYRHELIKHITTVKPNS